MTHIIYLSIIIFLLWFAAKAYDFANRKIKELRSFKIINESRNAPCEILAKYDKANVEFCKWMKNNNIKKEIIEKYNEFFKF